MGGSMIAALPAQRLLFAFRSKPIKPDFQEPWQEESLAVVFKVYDERPLQINPSSVTGVVVVMEVRAWRVGIVQ